MATTTDITNRVYKDVGKTEQTLVTLASNQKGAGVGLSLANKTAGSVTASVYVTDGSGTKGYYIKEILIGPNSAARLINGGEKLLLASNNSVSVVCDANNALDVIFSLVILTTT